MAGVTLTKKEKKYIIHLLNCRIEIMKVMVETESAFENILLISIETLEKAIAVIEGVKEAGEV